MIKLVITVSIRDFFLFLNFFVLFFLFYMLITGQNVSDRRASVRLVFMCSQRIEIF